MPVVIDIKENIGIHSYNETIVNERMKQQFSGNAFEVTCLSVTDLLVGLVMLEIPT